MSKNLLELLMTNGDQCFEKAHAMSKLFQLIYGNFYLDIDISVKDTVFFEMFNNVNIEFLKSLSARDERLKGTFF